MLLGRGIDNPRHTSVSELPVSPGRNPDNMTAGERRGEIAGILACGMLRSIRDARRRATANRANTPDSDDSRLDLSANSPLSVAPRSAG